MVMEPRVFLLILLSSTSALGQDGSADTIPTPVPLITGPPVVTTLAPVEPAAITTSTQGDVATTQTVFTKRVTEGTIPVTSVKVTSNTSVRVTDSTSVRVTDGTSESSSGVSSSPATVKPDTSTVPATAVVTDIPTTVADRVTTAESEQESTTVPAAAAEATPMHVINNEATTKGVTMYVHVSDTSSKQTTRSPVVEEIIVPKTVIPLGGDVIQNTTAAQTTKLDTTTEVVTTKQQVPVTTQPLPATTRPTPQKTTQKDLPSTNNNILDGQIKKNVLMSTLVQETTTEAMDPCDNNVQMIGNQRHYSSITEAGETHCDTSIEANWYTFKYKGESAVIPTQCIESGFCSTDHPIRIDLGGKEMPTDIGETITAHSCLYAIVAKKPDCCSVRRPVLIKKCNGFYVYKLPQVDRCSTGYCIRLPNETITERFLGLGKEKKNLTNSIFTKTKKPEPTKKGVPTKAILNTTTMALETTTTTAPVTHKVTTEVPTTTTTTSSTTTSTTTTVASTTALPTTKPTTTTELATQSTKAPVAVIGPKGLSDAQRRNTLSIAFLFSGTDFDDERRRTFNEKFKQAIIYLLMRNQQTRVKRAGGDGVIVDPPATTTQVITTIATGDNSGYEVVYAIKPELKNTTIPLSFFVQNATNSDDVVSIETLLALLNVTENREYIEKQVGMKIQGYQEGFPEGTSFSKNKEEETLFESHLGLWVAMIVLACICILCILASLIALRCRQKSMVGKKADYLTNKDHMKMEEGKHMTAVENPICDEEIMKGEAPPMTETTPNGNGTLHDVLTDLLNNENEENGWVVPLDEISEKENPEVEDTKL